MRQSELSWMETSAAYVEDLTEEQGRGKQGVRSQHGRGDAPTLVCENCGGGGFCTRCETLRLRVSGYTFRASQTVLHCLACGHTQRSSQQIERFRLEIAAWLSKHGIQSGGAFKFMRKALGLKAVELSRLMSLAPETLSRWERGHRQCDPKAFALLGAMVLDRLAGHQATMERLQALQTPAPETCSVDLTVLLRGAELSLP